MSEDSSSAIDKKKPLQVKKGKPNLQSPPLSRVLDSGLLEGPTKKMSPLKHVSPILKKYSTQRHGKNVKAIRPKTKTAPTPTATMAESVKQVTSSEQPPSPLRMEVFVEPYDLLHDPDNYRDHVFSPGTAHPSAVESFPDDTHEPLVEGMNELTVKNDLFKDDTSPPSNQTSKIVKFTHTERKRSRIIKKRNRLQKELEHTVPLVAADDKEACEERGYKYALSYFLKTKERLESDKETFEKFVELMNDFGSSNHNVVDLYHRIAALLREYPDLCEEFLAFLLPEQAIQCERFMEHLSLAEMMSFLRKIEVFFVKQPQHLRKIYSCWRSLAENPHLTLGEVRSTIIPLLKGNRLLEESFMELLPGAAPPESKMGYGGGTDVEVLPYEDMDSELSDEEKRSERVDVPGRKTDTYGGENCHCCCHGTDDQSYASRSKHCVPCGMKFIAGKVYLQTEHGLRPVRVNFGSNTSYSSNLKRLNADPRKLQRSRGPRRSRASTTRPGGTGISGTTSKDNSPVKGSGKPISQEEEEEESSAKQKSPRSRSKSMSSRTKEKQAVRTPPQNSARTTPRTKGKGKISIFPPAATYDEIALPAPEPTAAKSDATDFSVLSDVLRQEKIDQAKVKDDLLKDQEVFQIGSDDSTGEETGPVNEDRPESGDVLEEGDDVIEEGDGIEEVDGDVISDCSDDGEGDGDSDEAMSVDSYGESDGDGESEVEGEGSSQGSEDSMPKLAWTREEDRVILQCFQSAGGQDDSITFAKIKQLLPARTIDEIKERFHVLMKLIQQLA